MFLNIIRRIKMSSSFLPLTGYLRTLCTSLFVLFFSRSPELQWWRNHEVVLFIFGDSIFDAGTNDYINTSIQGNVIPYGESFFSYPTGRFSNGRLIPDFIGKTSYLASYCIYAYILNEQLVYLLLIDLYYIIVSHFPCSRICRFAINSTVSAA